MSDWTAFPLGWAHYLAGGLCIGAGVSLLFLVTGRIGGMSTVFSSSWSYVLSHPFFAQPSLRRSRGWRLVYALGLVLGAALWRVSLGSPALPIAQPAWQLLIGGFLVGYGARLGQGCTSGHGICGLASLQLPSLKAVLTFMGTAFLTAGLVARVMG